MTNVVRSAVLRDRVRRLDRAQQAYLLGKMLAQFSASAADNLLADAEAFQAPPTSGFGQTGGTRRG